MNVQAANTFRHQLREAMQRAGISQRQLAEKAETSYSGINRILQGHQAPTLELADRLADALGIPLISLLEKNSRRVAKSA
jgi:transcriptional regulator with XRE-family HTH domain